MNLINKMISIIIIIEFTESDSSPVNATEEHVRFDLFCTSYTRSCIIISTVSCLAVYAHVLT